jgi:hypothetical protein
MIPSVLLTSNVTWWTINSESFVTKMAAIVSTLQFGSLCINSIPIDYINRDKGAFTYEVRLLDR